MYNLIVSIINHTYTTGDQMQTTILNICSALICIFSAMTLDMIVRTIRAFIHKL